MLYKIYRGHYLKLFHSDKRCCIINNEDHLQSIIDEIGSILNSTTKYFKEFNEQQNFILNNDRFDDVHVICMDIEKFTFNVENQFSSSIVEQLEKFSILSKWVNLWLDNQVNKQPEQFDIPLTKNDFWMKCMGDGYLIAFKRPNYPFELAKYIKKLENDSSKNTSKLRVRIGLNTGQVRSVLDSIGNEDLIGPGINFAARTMSLSKENHLLASNSFKTNLTQLMGEEIPGDNILRIGYVKNNKIEFYNIFDSDYGTADPPETSDKPMT